MLIILKRTGGGLLKTQLFWNTDTSATETNTTSSLSTYIRGSGTLSGYDLLIDAYESGSSIIYVLWRNDLITPLLFTIPNAKILSLSTAGDTKQLSYFDINSKTEIAFQRFHGDAGLSNFKAADNNYIRSTNDVLASQCVGVNEATWLSDGLGGVSKAVIYNSATCGFVVATSGTVVTESIVIRLDNECKENPIYLRWLNTLGGYDQYLFHFNNEVVYDTKDRGQFQKNYTNLSAKTNNYSRGKTATKTIIVGAEGLSQNDYDGIFPDLLLSPNIHMINAAGVETPVKISEGSWSINARDTLHSIEFELELPEYFTITQ